LISGLRRLVAHWGKDAAKRAASMPRGGPHKAEKAPSETLANQWGRKKEKKKSTRQASREAVAEEEEEA